MKSTEMTYTEFDSRLFKLHNLVMDPEHFKLLDGTADDLTKSVSYTHLTLPTKA